MNLAYNSLIPPVSKILGRFGIEAGFLIPTKTGMEKSIMDATWPVREYLSRTGFHNYRQQAQGVASKRVLPIKIVHGGSIVDSSVSLYRPETKEGDPRIWIYNLGKYAAAGELIGLIVVDDQLYSINCSRTDLKTELENPSTFLGQLVSRVNTGSEVASDLLSKLRDVGQKGFIPSLREGDTGIGFTLETYLGIEANSRRTPDYKGIEIKSGRIKKRRNITLFSNIPNWDSSPFSARKALEAFGYKDRKTGRLQLYCSVNALQSNSLGFRLVAREENDHLVNVSTKNNPNGEDVFLWALGSLRSALAAKHRETFWVGAEAKIVSGKEHFHFVKARHTRTPMSSTFERLLFSGGVFVDLTMSERGEAAVRDHGYLFRIHEDCFDDLFPEVASYSLIS